MILVLTGSLKKPFKRLITTVLSATECMETPIIMQTGTIRILERRDSLYWYPYIPTETLLKLLPLASHIITATGEGIMADLLETQSVQPLFFPRSPTHGEHVDSQQLMLAKEFKKRGYGTVGFSKKDIQLYLTTHHQALHREDRAKTMVLCNFLSKYCNNLNSLN